jgi:two-component system sensor histidine kinase/response regulator
MMYRLVITTFLIAYVTAAGAQSVDVGTLFEKLRSAKQDTDKVLLFYTISKSYLNKNPDSAILMGQYAFTLARKARYAKGVALSLLAQGEAQETKGSYSEGLRNELQALRISDSLGTEELTGRLYDALGILYMERGDNPRARDYFNKSLQIARQYNSNVIILSLLVNLAEVYKKNGEYDSAIACNMRAADLAKGGADSLSLAIALFNIGDNYVRKKQPSVALDYLQRSLGMSRRLNDLEGLAYSHNAIARAYQALEQPALSLTYAAMGLAEAERLGLQEVSRESCDILYMSYQKTGDYAAALKYRDREIAIKDSLYTIERDKEIRNLQSSYEVEKEQHQIDLLNKDKVIHQEDVSRERTIRNIFLSGFVLLVVFSFFLYRSNAAKKKLNALLRIQNEGMTLQNKLLEDLNALKNRILSIIGHDLRGPIGSLRNVVDLMNAEALTEDDIRHLGSRLDDSLLGTEHLLENLLFWAKSQMEGMQVHARTFDILTTIEGNIRLLQSRAQDKKVRLRVEEGASMVIVHADETMIDIVLRNLLENAIKFSLEGGTVWVKAETIEGTVRVIIKDTGQGIAPEDQPRIFDKSASFTTAGTGQEKGSGLGLTLCRDLVEKNNGTIGFSSSPGWGSSFWFTLPVEAMKA